MTVDEVAGRLRVHPRTVKRWLAEGKLRGKLLGDRAGCASTKPTSAGSWPRMAATKTTSAPPCPQT